MPSTPTLDERLEILAATYAHWHACADCGTRDYAEDERCRSCGSSDVDPLPLEGPLAVEQAFDEQPSRGAQTDTRDTA